MTTQPEVFFFFSSFLTPNPVIEMESQTDVFARVPPPSFYSLKVNELWGGLVLCVLR